MCSFSCSMTFSRKKSFSVKTWPRMYWVLATATAAQKSSHSSQGKTQMFHRKHHHIMFGFFFFFVMGLELGVLHLLGWCSTTGASLEPFWLCLFLR
jgi:hypothetical protein